MEITDDNRNFNIGIKIVGRDTYKRHLVNKLSIIFNLFLLCLSYLNYNKLYDNIIFNIDKKFLVPKFD